MGRHFVPCNGRRPAKHLVLPAYYLETSAVVFFEVLEQAAHEVPADKLIFGTDGPQVDQRVEMNKFRLLQLPREKEDKILSGNILRVLG